MQTPFDYSDLGLPDLAGLWSGAKAEELLAIERRRQIGSAIGKLLAAPSDVYEGTIKNTAGLHNVSVGYSVTRKVDDTDGLHAKLPGPIFDRLIRFKPEINTEELRFLERNEPDYYAIVCDFITTKPSSPSVKVEPI